MKRVFLTSGLILCMAAQANAVQTTDIGTGASNANCVETTLGVDNGSTSFEAKWEAIVSGAIALDSNRYATSSSATASSTASTAAAPTPVYSKYENGMYSSSANATAGTNAITAITTAPVMTGYTFQGFYTGKAGSGTKVINSDKSFTSDADTQVATNTTATWYAHWSPLEKTITLNTNTANHGSAAGTPTTLYTRYDSGAYTDSGRTKLMSTSANGLTTNPTGNTYTLTLNTNLSSLAQTHQESEVTAASGTKVASQSSAMTFKGFYSAASGGTQYIGSTGKITTDGANRAKGRTANDEWFAQYQCTNLTPYTPQLTGYNFAGWKDTETDSIVSSTCLTGNKTLTAQWTAKGYDVTYDVGAHGTCPSATCTDDNGAQHVYVNDATYDQDYTARTYASVGFTQSTGYTFKEWNTESNGSGSAYTGDTPWKRTSNLIVYAQYTPNISGNITLDDSIWTDSNTNNVYSLTKSTLDKSGGDKIVFSAYDYAIYTLKPTTSNYTAATNQISSIYQVPTATGFTFQGFYNQKQILHSTSNSGTLMINASKAIQAAAKTQVATTNGTTTWYARWMPVISGNITLDSKIYTSAEDTTGITVTNSDPTTVWSAYDYSMYKNVKPTTSNYVTASTTCTNGTTCKITSITAPSKTGYTFGGFYTSKNVVNGTASGTKVINADGTFTDVAKKQRTDTSAATWYAYWTANTTTVTYNCGNPVSGSASTASFKSGSGATVFDNPSNHSNTATYDLSYTHPVGANTCQMAGYTFASWHCVQGTTPSISGNTITNNGITSGKWSADMANVTCTAKWTQNEINLNYNANCASGTTCASWSNDAATQCTYDTTFNLPTQPAKTGYTFRGWTVASGNN